MPARSLPISLMVLLLALPANTLAEPNVGGAIHGTGTASTFTVYKDGGVTFSGGLAQRTIVCSPCLIRLTLVGGDVLVAEDGAVSALAPDAYEVREYSGTFTYKQRAPGDFAITMDGRGSVHET